MKIMLLNGVPVQVSDTMNPNGEVVVIHENGDRELTNVKNLKEITRGPVEQKRFARPYR